MFTGIIQSKGRVQSNAPTASGCRLRIHLGRLDISGIAIGDSIAVNGVCLTVVMLDDSEAEFDVSGETLDKTIIADWRTGDDVNLETALTLATPLGGHLVSGHVDGIGILDHREMQGENTLMHFSVLPQLGRLVAEKGSVCLDGVSLTSNQVLGDSKTKTRFSVMIVPHTLAETSLGKLEVGARLHVEIDIIARYLDRMQRFDEAGIQLD